MIKRKKEDKKLSLIFVLILLSLILSITIFSFSNLIYIQAQTSAFPTGGSTPTTSGGTQTGTQQGATTPTPEEQTKTGAENPPEQGTVGNTGNQNQDLGGLVGLENQQGSTGGTTGTTPEPGIIDTGTQPGDTTNTGTGEAKPSLEGQNLDFQRDLNTKPGTEKVDIKPNDAKGEPKLELNDNEFSAQPAKEGEGQLGEAKFSIEKKEGEKFAEAGEGTQYKVEGGENAKGNAVDELSGREVELSKDTQVKITENPDGTRKVEMTVPEGGEIHQPGERKNGEEEEEKETDFKWSGNNLNWFDAQGNSHTVNGELAWNQKLGFYTPAGAKSSIDGVDIYSKGANGNFDTQIFTDGKSHAQDPNVLGAYASFGKDNLATGSNNKDFGPALQFQQGNKYGVNIDSQTDRVAIQANPGGEISLTNTGSPNGPNLQLTGTGGAINNGQTKYFSNDNRFESSKSSALQSYTSSPMNINPTRADGSSMLSNGGILRTNNNNGYQQVPNDYNNAAPSDSKLNNNIPNAPSSSNNNPLINPKQTQPNSIPNQQAQAGVNAPAIANQKDLFNSLNQEQRKNFNSLPQELKTWVTTQPETLSKQQRYLDLNPNERSLLGAQNLETVRGILGSQNDIHQELSKLPNAGSYIGPLNTQFGQYPQGSGGYGNTRNFQVTGGTQAENDQFAASAEYYRNRLAVEFTGKQLKGDWSKKVPINIKSRQDLGNGGATSFVFDQGEVFNWNMNIQGSKEVLTNSVIPHEVMHTIAASTFRQPLPRWIDEGVAQTVEATSERQRLDGFLTNSQNTGSLQTGRGIPFDDMMAMKDYPSDRNNIMPLYAQGHSATQYLIHRGGGGTEGRRELYNFMGDAMKNNGDWAGALKQHYGLTPNQFQQSWLNDFINNGHRSRGY